jgi:hypothetical protein
VTAVSPVVMAAMHDDRAPAVTVHDDSCLFDEGLRRRGQSLVDRERRGYGLIRHQGQPGGGSDGATQQGP